LTRKSAANDINGKSIWLESSDVVVTGDIWPVFSQHGSAIGIDFTEGDGSHSGSLKAETEAADS
jgi:hypothetical protein